MEKSRGENMKIKFKEQKGITLIEIVITLALITTILGIFLSIFSVSNKAYNTGSHQSFMQKDARLAARLIENQLRNAKTISDSSLEDEDTYYMLKLEKEEDQDLYHLLLITIEEDKSIKEVSFGREFKSITFKGGKEAGLLNYSLEFDGYDLFSTIKLNNINASVLPEKTSILYFSTY